MNTRNIDKENFGFIEFLKSIPTLLFLVFVAMIAAFFLYACMAGVSTMEFARFFIRTFI